MLGGPLHAQGDPGARVHALHTHVGGRVSRVTCRNIINLCSDPWLWRHERALHATEEETRAALVRRMVDHVMAANQVQADTL